MKLVAAARCAAALLERDAEAYARLITSETRKTIRSARAEVAKCALVARYYADQAPAMLADEIVETGASRSFIRYAPLGTILGVMPWNFPLWQVFRFAIPALLAGNDVIVKHSPLVPGCAAALEALLREAGFEGKFFATALPAEAVYPLLADERVRAVVLTGGEEAGRSVAIAAGRHIKKVSLELGGSDAFLVLPSADLGRAVDAAVRSRIHCNGQACTAAKRFIVHRDVADEFEARFVAAMATLHVSDPFDERTDVGPLINEEVAGRLQLQVDGSLAMGAQVAVGGRRGEGTFFAPTVLTNVPLDAPVAREETFGPVAAVFRANGVDEAIAIANGTRFGLGASVWTSDRAEADRCIDRIEAGQVFVNAIVSSDPRLPFGGTKSSGFGRELGRAGIREMTNVKTVWIG